MSKKPHQGLKSFNLRKKLSVKDLKHLLMQRKKDIELCISWHSLLENEESSLYIQKHQEISQQTHLKHRLVLLPIV